MTGAREFGEVFFTDVRVPKDQVLGEVGGGWEVAMLLLSFERGSSAIGQYTGFRRELDEIVDVARRTRRGGAHGGQGPGAAAAASRSRSSSWRRSLHSLHILTQVEQGKELGFEASMTKLQWSETHQDIGELYMDVAGPEG